MATQPSLADFTVSQLGTNLELAEVAERGISVESLSLLREKGLTFTEMAAVIPPRTLKHRKARGEALSSEETQRAVRVARTIALAERVFGDPGKAMRWLREPDNRLSDRTPLSFLQTESGGRLIESMLWGIDEGIYS